MRSFTTKGSSAGGWQVAERWERSIRVRRKVERWAGWAAYGDGRGRDEAGPDPKAGWVYGGYGGM